LFIISLYFPPTTKQNKYEGNDFTLLPFTKHPDTNMASSDATAVLRELQQTNENWVSMVFFPRFSLHYYGFCPRTPYFNYPTAFQ
jgi:hypothetical protein